MGKAKKTIRNLRLKQERENRNWSQADLAEKIDAPSYHLISRWERGEAFPSHHYCRALCEAFGKDAKALGLVREDDDGGKEQHSQQEKATLADPLVLLDPIQQLVTHVTARETVIDSTQDTQPSEVEVDQPNQSQIQESFPRVWVVPYHQNPFFSVREVVVARVHDTLTSHRVGELPTPLVISGIGGIGKTQVALEYVYHYRSNYQVILWARADAVEALTADFIRFADAMDVPEKYEPDQQAVIEGVKRQLQMMPGNWLLVFDNVISTDMVKELIPTARNGHILLTAQAQHSGTFAQNIVLDSMTPEEGALFLLRRCKILSKGEPLESASQEQRSCAEAISREMCGLPLAIDQAGAYIEETGCALSDYLQLYQAKRPVLLKERGVHDSDHPASVSATVSLAIAKIKKKKRAAAELLQCCAYVHPDAIPLEFFLEGASKLGWRLKRLADNQLYLDGLIRILLTFSLVHRDVTTKTISIHRLVQTILKDQMTEKQRRQWSTRSVRASHKVLDSVPWQRYRHYLPQLHVCAELIEQWDFKFPEAAELLYQAGVTLREQALYSQAKLFSEQAIGIIQAARGPTHADTINPLTNLAQVQEELGDYQFAERLYRQALTVAGESFGLMHPAVASCFHNLSHFYRI
jgi:transcriptional regulator with XRE-family HTH domain/tetratricopeptide (TPR) repeat protein